MGKNAKTMLRGRSAVTGQFTSVKTAQRLGATHVVERVSRPGRFLKGK